MAMSSTQSPNALDFKSEISSMISSPRARAHSPKVLPEIVNNVHPTALVPSLHKKTHFKAATSVFLNHKGSLSHSERETDETGRHVEKILNDISVKRNLQNILDNTSKHVSRLRSNHNKTPEISLFNKSNPIKNAMDKLNNNRSIEFNDRETLSITKRSGTNASDTVTSPFTISIKQAERYCQVENNPLKKVINEEGRNLSPSQIAREMLLNTKVLRRKDFTVAPLKAGQGMGKDPNSPSNRNNVSFARDNSGTISVKRNLMGTKSALGYSSNKQPVTPFRLLE